MPGFGLYLMHTYVNGELDASCMDALQVLSMGRSGPVLNNHGSGSETLCCRGDEFLSIRPEIDAAGQRRRVGVGASWVSHTVGKVGHAHLEGRKVQWTPSPTRQARSSLRQEQDGGLRLCCYSCRPYRRACLFGPLLCRRSPPKGELVQLAGNLKNHLSLSKRGLGIRDSFDPQLKRIIIIIF